jgi:hypothetical protein
MDSGDFQNKEMNIGITLVIISQKLAHFPMPIRERTITDSIPNSQQKP